MRQSHTSRVPACGLTSGARRRALAVLVLAFAGILGISAQRVSVKTNALYWAAATANVGAEFRVNRHVTLNVEALLHRFKGGRLDTRVEAFTPEARYWFSARPQAGHFVGLMATAADYDLLLKDTRHKGTALGAGLTYGYSFVLSRHWSLECTVGGGPVRIREKHFNTATEPEPGSPNKTKWTLSPTKAGVTFVYIIR